MNILEKLALLVRPPALPMPHVGQDMNSRSITHPRAGASGSRHDAALFVDTGLRADGWQNIVNGLGQQLRDKSNLGNLQYQLDLLYQLDAETLWRGSWLADRIVSKLPDEAIRMGYTIAVENDGDRELAKELESYQLEMNTIGEIHEALTYERAYGGSGIFLGVDDGATDLSQPLNLDNIKSFKWTNVLTPLELFPRIWYGDPRAPKYGMPAIYRLQRLAYVAGLSLPSESISEQYAMPLIHESRIIRFDGVRVSRRHILQRNGWGDPVLQRCQKVISDAELSWNAIALLIQDFSQGVYGVKGLAELQASADPLDNQVVAKKIQALDFGKSVARAIIIDSEESYERQGSPVTGLDEMMAKVILQVAAAADMPVSVLVGQPPKGFNSTGDAEADNWKAHIKSYQTRKLLPALRQMTRLQFRSKDGPTGGKEPKKWSIQFKALDQLNDKDREQARLFTAQRDQIYISTGVVMPEEIAVARFGADEYSPELQLNLDARAQMQRAVARATANPEGTPDTTPPAVSGGENKISDPTTLGVNNGEPS